MSDFNEEMEAINDLLNRDNISSVIKAMDKAYAISAAIRQMEIAEEKAKLELMAKEQREYVKKRIAALKFKAARQLNLFKEY